MNDKRFLVLDIETITDWELVRSIFHMPAEANIDELKEQLYSKYSSGFPPAAFHVPICIALIDVDHESCRVNNATVLENSDEKNLLQQFWRVTKLRRSKPIQTAFVSFNGRSFDLPCLFLRSLKHRVPIVPWDRNRYSFEASHDVCDDLSEFGATGRVSLDIISKLLGLQGKTGTKGEMVEDLYRKGERKRIYDYCMEDALNTYLIWLTIKYVRGQLKEGPYNEAFQSAPEIVRNCRAVTDGFFSSVPEAPDESVTVSSNSTE
jgi:predicted PolB exonuclease-like 3'-5' exonuclease